MSINVIDAIRAGRYQNAVPYRVDREPAHDDMTMRQIREQKEADKQRQREQYARYHAEEARLHALFKTDLETEHGVSGHPKAERLFQIAWDQGHSNGYEEVAGVYSELVELIK